MSEKKVDVMSVISGLDTLAARIEVPYPHWLGGNDADQGPSYCRECAQKHVDAGECEFVDGGWPQENDSCCHCEDCGRLLDYTLTDHGVAEELRQFKGNRLRGVISPETAYHLARVLDAYHEHPEVLGLLPKARRAISRIDGDV